MLRTIDLKTKCSGWGLDLEKVLISDGKDPDSINLRFQLEGLWSIISSPPVIYIFCTEEEAEPIVLKHCILAYWIEKLGLGTHVKIYCKKEPGKYTLNYNFSVLQILKTPMCRDELRQFQPDLEI
jgi:hypothetical protein